MTRIHLTSCLKHLNNLNARVEEILQQRHSEVVRTALEYNLRKHDNTQGQCGCDYCRKIPEYVRARMHMQRIKKQLENDYWDDDLDLYKFHSAKATVERLKREKDELKSLNPSHPDLPPYMMDDEGNMVLLREVLASDGTLLYDHYDIVKQRVNCNTIRDDSGTMAFSKMKDIVSSALSSWSGYDPIHSVMLDEPEEGWKPTVKEYFADFGPRGEIEEKKTRKISTAGLLELRKSESPEYEAIGIAHNEEQLIALGGEPPVLDMDYPILVESDGRTTSYKTLK